MIGTGLSKAVYAKYNCVNGVVSYSEGSVYSEFVDHNADIKTAEGNELWTDNRLKYSDKSFESGTFTENVDGIQIDTAAVLLGITPSNLEVGGSTVQEYRYDNDMKAPYIGKGLIERYEEEDGTELFRGIVLTKVQYNLPKNSMKTFAGKKEFQIKELTGIIMRDDSAKHCWMRESWFDTEAAAYEYICTVLNIPVSTPDASITSLDIGTLTLTPAFDGGVYEYTAATENATDSITVEAADDGADIEILNGAVPVANGGVAVWTEGANTLTINVKNGTAEKAYTVTVTYTPVPAG